MVILVYRYTIHLKRIHEFQLFQDPVSAVLCSAVNCLAKLEKKLMVDMASRVASSMKEMYCLVQLIVGCM